MARQPMVARTVLWKLKRSTARCIEHGTFPVLREDLLPLSEVNGKRKCRPQNADSYVAYHIRDLHE